MAERETEEKQVAMTPERGAAEAEALATEIVEKLEATGALLPLTSNHAIVFGILAGAETMRAINESLAPTAAEANALDRQVTTLRAQLAAAQAREQALRELLERIAGWDQMDDSADGPYWRKEIAAVLKEGQ